jgi:hypothetical protein
MIDGWVPHISIWRINLSQSVGFHQLPRAACYASEVRRLRTPRRHERSSADPLPLDIPPILTITRSIVSFRKN